jgi:hypothetical protein
MAFLFVNDKKNAAPHIVCGAANDARGWLDA